MARAVDNVNIGDVETFAAHQRRQEAMQSVEVRHREEHLARERLQPAAGVAGTVAQDRLAHAVRDFRLQLLETGILAPDPLARRETDAAAAAFDRRDQVGQERRIILSVAVECGHDGAARGTDAAAHRRRLPARVGMFQLPKLIVPLHQISQPFGGRIRRAVIDIDDLIDPAAFERADDFRNQRRDVFRFVAHRHNDGNGDSTSVGSSQIGTRLVGLERPGTGLIGPPGGVRFYGAKAPRATLLRRPDEGPTRDTMVPSRWIANPSRRAANQYRTNITPMTPTSAPATTSLG